MGFGINAALMAGVNDGQRQIEGDQFLRESRARETATADLNAQVQRGAVEDMTRTRDSQKALRDASATGFMNDGGRQGSLKAMREAAASRGEHDTVAQLDAASKQLEDEGVTAMVKGALMGKPGPDLADIYNSHGKKRVVPDSVRVVNGILYSKNAADGTDLPPLNLSQAAILTGLVKPPKFISLGGGQMGNEGTGEATGTRVATPGQQLLDNKGNLVGSQVPSIKEHAPVKYDAQKITVNGVEKTVWANTQNPADMYEYDPGAPGKPAESSFIPGRSKGAVPPTQSGVRRVGAASAQPATTLDAAKAAVAKAVSAGASPDEIVKGLQSKGYPAAMIQQIIQKPVAAPPTPAAVAPVQPPVAESKPLVFTPNVPPPPHPTAPRAEWLKWERKWGDKAAVNDEIQRRETESAAVERDAKNAGLKGRMKSQQAAGLADGGKVHGYGIGGR